ncbi:hypothetical protein CHLNCDRAFT_55724, partial [Chlorella variabilis]
WEELIERCQEAGVDAFEINFSCPHGMPERRMGMAMGQDCELLHEVCGWINAKSTIPVWAKMTPNVTDISMPARTALAAGCEGIAAINTITSVMGINLDTLRPEPCVEGHTTPGGYSSRAVKPIALAKCMSIAQMMRHDFPHSAASLSGLGGVNTGRDAAEFILLGSNTVQVCTGVMLYGYPLIKKLCGGLQAFMQQHDFASVEQFRGASLPYFTTHHELVRMQREAVEAKKKARVGLAKDDEWIGARRCRRTFRCRARQDDVLANEPEIKLVNGAVTSGPSLAVEVNGLKLPNPFVIGSGPPGTNYAVMKKAFEEGWGAVIAKTVSLDSSKVINVTPRYAKMKSSDGKE